MARSARVGKLRASLTPAETDVLVALLRRQGQLVSTETLIEALGPGAMPVGVRALVAGLRSKLTLIGLTDLIEAVGANSYIVR